MYRPNMSDAVIEAMIEAEPFGMGSARHVYAITGDPDHVVKKSVQSRPSSNMLEWTIWLGARNQPELAKVLGRCECLSDTGRYLIMERLDDISPADYANVPDVPAWFNDRKPSAFGKRDGPIKIRDYGLVMYDDLLNAILVRPPAFALSARTDALLRK